jgi:CRP-like cAMP-binding protein
MQKAHPSWRENRLLARLSVAECGSFLAMLEPVALPVKKQIFKVNGPVDKVYFPTSGVISAMTVMSDGSAIEVATIGREGMAGLSAILGGMTSPYEVIVQVSGDGLCMSAEAFASEVNHGGPLRQLIASYYNAFSVQVSFAVACNGLHKVEQRCCRWLLMTHDRVGADVLPLTHEFLGIMLGVRRASVTEVLNSLEAQGIVGNERGEIEILDRQRLEQHSCECYRQVQQQYERAFE